MKTPWLALWPALESMASVSGEYDHLTNLLLKCFRLFLAIKASALAVPTGAMA
jgi:hypothetical protein